jgi:hypothetical protein
MASFVALASNRNSTIILNWWLAIAQALGRTHQRKRDRCLFIVSSSSLNPFAAF